MTGPSRISDLPLGTVTTDDYIVFVDQADNTTKKAPVSALPSGGGGGTTWGSITGTLSSQTDLNTALSNKADLVAGKVPSSQLPSYVDDVETYANLASFPATGETGKIYIALDSNKGYRWNGSSYTELFTSGGGDASTNTSTSVDGEIALFSGTGGKTIKRATTTGLLKASSGVLAQAVAGVDYVTYWNNVPGTPVRTANTTFTVTDTSNTNKYDLLLSRGTVLRWKESGVDKFGMIASASYATNTVTVTLGGDVMASIDSGTLKYAIAKANIARFVYGGTIGSVVNDAFARLYPTNTIRLLAYDAHHATAGTTNATTYTISKNSSSGASTIGSAVSIASAGVDSSLVFATAGTTATTNDYLAVNITGVSTTAATGAYINVYYFENNNIYLA